MTVDVRFGAAGAVTGTGRNFITGGDTPVSGTVTYASDSFDPAATGDSNPTFTGALNGVLDLGGDREYTFSNLRMTGVFAGDAAGKIAALGRDTFTFQGDNVTVGFFAAFGAERQ